MDDLPSGQLRLNEVPFDEIDRSLSIISSDENEDLSQTKSSDPHFCSSTPVKTSYRCHSVAAGNCHLEESLHVELCPSLEKSEAITCLAEDDFITIDASMSSLSIAENDENSFQNNSLCLDKVSSSQTFAERTGRSHASNDSHLKPDDLRMSVVKSKLPGTSTSAPSITSRDSQKFSAIGSKTNVSYGKLMEFHPSLKKGTQTEKEKKCLRRKKFLQEKRKKRKKAAAKAVGKEEKENQQDFSVPNIGKPSNLTKLGSNAEKCHSEYGKHVRHALQIIQNWIGEAPPEKKDSERKTQEFVSDDKDENLDINDPEWDCMKCLKTDDERYKAVKVCWKSKRAPNPQRDLTFHSYRQKRLKGHNKAVHCKKRIANDKAEFGPVSKSRKMVEAPCTLFLDRKIANAKEQFRSQQNDNLLLCTQVTQDIEAAYIKRSEKITRQYHKEINHVKRMSLDAKSQKLVLKSLDQWLDQQKKALEENILEEKKKVKKHKDNALSYLHNNFNFMLNKLEKARNEVLKFNQFYCGLNKIDPTILRGQFLDEIVALEDMYLNYENHYGLNRE